MFMPAFLFSVWAIKTKNKTEQEMLWDTQPTTAKGKHVAELVSHLSSIRLSLREAESSLSMWSR